MRQETKELYQFEELDDSAKETARSWYRDCSVHDEWWDHVLDYSKETGALIGIDIENIYFSGFSSQGDGACFTGSYSYVKQGLKTIKMERPNDSELQSIAENLQELQRANFYRLSASVSHSGHYNHELCTRISVDNCEGLPVSADTEETLIELLREFMQWIYSRLNAEYDYLNSDEVVDGNITCNEYEFLETGERA